MAVVVVTVVVAVVVVLKTVRVGIQVATPGCGSLVRSNFILAQVLSGRSVPQIQ